jgi:hypothetical protein
MEAFFLAIRREKTKGLTKTIVKTWEEAWNFLLHCSTKRRTAPTTMNVTSSRSHGIFTLTIKKLAAYMEIRFLTKL